MARPPTVKEVTILSVGHERTHHQNDISRGSTSKSHDLFIFTSPSTSTSPAPGETFDHKQLRLASKGSPSTMWEPEMKTWPKPTGENPTRVDLRWPLGMAEKVQQELFEPSTLPEQEVNEVEGNEPVAQPKQWRWDPYKKFSDRGLFHFFERFPYRQGNFHDREVFASFSINQALSAYPSTFLATGGIMDNQWVSVGPQNSALIKTKIRADAHHDIDSESRNAKESAQDDDPTQRVSAAAQTVMSASPSCLGPPINPCLRYLKMQICGQYGPNRMPIWKSPLIPNLGSPNDGGKGLLSHQVTALVWLLSRFFGDLPELFYRDPRVHGKLSNISTVGDAQNSHKLAGPKYFGGILADSMGLGKTLITTALLDLLVRKELHDAEVAIYDEQADGQAEKKVKRRGHHPILLVAPNVAVLTQWIEEICNICNESVIETIIVASNIRDESSSYGERVIRLARNDFLAWPDRLDYVWNDQDIRAAKSIILVTLDVWSNRTMTTTQMEDGKKQHKSSFTELGREFSLVIVDEAHKLKNANTRYWRSVYHIRRQFTLLITATPCVNSLADLFGLARLLWLQPEMYLKSDAAQWQFIEEKFTNLASLQQLDRLEYSNDLHLVAGRPSLLAKVLFKSRAGSSNRPQHQDIHITRQNLRYYEWLAVLRRSPSTILYKEWDRRETFSLEGVYPKVDYYTVVIKPGVKYDEEYQTAHLDLLTEHLRSLKQWNVSKEENKKAKRSLDMAKSSVAGSHRRFQLASASLDVYDLDQLLMVNGKSTLAHHVTAMREAGVDFPRLAFFLCWSATNKPMTHIEYMKLAVRNSPVLRYILKYIDDYILDRRANEKIKKLMIIETNNMVAFWYEIILQFLGFECRTMHAGLNGDERQDLIDSFNSDDINSCQILIQMCSVGFAGTNLHKACSRVLVASQAHSLAVQEQAIHRVIRVGQQSHVLVHRVKLDNSYHDFIESRQIEKFLPEIGGRAHGTTRKILVDLLNIFQYECIQAWHTPRGQKLLITKNLLIDEDWGPEHGSSPDVKRVKLNSGASAVAKPRDDDVVSDDFDPAMYGNRKDPRTGPAPDGTELGWKGKSGFAQDDYSDFLRLRVREEYYREYVNLPKEIRCRFSHKKNNLRRLLSFALGDSGQPSTAQWTEKHLDHPAVLERALELMLRVRLGAREIAMLPYPMIEFANAAEWRRELLMKMLGGVATVEADLDHSENTRSASDRPPMEDIDGKSLWQIDMRLEQEALGIKPTPSEYTDTSSIVKPPEKISTKKALKQALEPGKNSSSQESSGSSTNDEERAKLEEAAKKRRAATKPRRPAKTKKNKSDGVKQKVMKEVYDSESDYEAYEDARQGYPNSQNNKLSG
ncbi:P-loop containing nucleoside triphosphate hydrolase protein [Xylariaceae sp. FL0255]|nr:P-loop containing nucleoside triphosphate hydrolase protein [Xylariaceae sp. FL0255]